MRSSDLKLYGISMVRNESDIVRTNVLYHLSIGFDGFLIFDDGSEDGTDRVLQELAREHPRVRWTRGGNEVFKQGEVFTELAREAYQKGADWIIPVDADDFWRARSGNLKEVLSRTAAAALHARTIDYVQRREQKESSPDALLHMTRRVAEPVDREEAGEKLRAGKTSYVAMERVRRWIFRSSPEVSLVRGAHAVEGVEGRRQKTEEIFCMHAPLRSRAVLEAKALSSARRGNRIAEAALGPGWLYSRWRRIQEASGLEEEWAANSYKDGHIDLYGEPCPVVFDPALRDAVAPFVRHPHRRGLLGRLLSR